MNAFPILSLILFAIGLAVYGAIVFWAGMRGLLWVAVLVTLPAALGGLMALLDPIETPQQAGFMFRHFGWFVVGQFLFGALVYWAGRQKARRQSTRKDV
ncbi:MAG: hypothetical protein J2O44_00450 [Porphyrobacter sp.]|nr:hypothetical protein [Porphyrobacter sp.]